MKLAEFLSPDAPVKLNPGRIAYWEAEFSDPNLKKAIYENPRMFSRVIEGLSDGHFQIAHDASGITDLAEQLSNCETLHDVGLAWCAPRLFLCLFNKETRTACGDLSSAQVELVTALRDHSDVDTIPVLPQESMLETEGRLCLIAWLVEQDTPEAFAFVQRFGPEEELNVQQSIKRAKFFDSYLEYCKKRVN